MTCNHIFGIPAVAFVAISSLGVAQGATLAELKVSQESALKQIRETSRTDVGKLCDQLVAAFVRGKETATKAGDEELAKNYQTEIDLIELVGEPQSLESPVPAINKFQSIYKAAKDERIGKMHRAIVAWQKAADAELAALESKLRAENSTASAQDAAAERERLESLVGDSVIVVASLGGAVKDKEAPTSAAPEAPNSKPWQSLTKNRWKRIDGSKYFLGMITENNGIEFGGQKYKKRDLIYTHAPGKVIYEFKDAITEFSATGCLEERSGGGDVKFIVETGEGEIFRSQPVTKSRNQEEISLKFKPTTKLVLVVDENGGAQEDWAFWLLPRYR